MGRTDYAEGAEGCADCSCMQAHMAEGIKTQSRVLGVLWSEDMHVVAQKTSSG